VGNLAFLLIPVAVALIGLLVIGLKMLLDRPKPYDEITQFQRGLDALAPKSGSSSAGHRRRGTR